MILITLNAQRVRFSVWREYFEVASFPLPTHTTGPCAINRLLNFRPTYTHTHLPIIHRPNSNFSVVVKTQLHILFSRGAGGGEGHFQHSLGRTNISPHPPTHPHSRVTKKAHLCWIQFSARAQVQQLHCISPTNEIEGNGPNNCGQY